MESKSNSKGEVCIYYIVMYKGSNFVMQNLINNKVIISTQVIRTAFRQYFLYYSTDSPNMYLDILLLGWFDLGCIFQLN